MLEVLKHLGDGAVRCITLATSEGLTRGMEVTATGGPISVPVGEDPGPDVQRAGKSH